MYLFHCPVGGLIRAVTGSRFEAATGFRSLVEQGGFFLVSLALTYALALASWNLIEKPFLRLKTYFPTLGRGVPTLPPVSQPLDPGDSDPGELALAHTTSSGSSTASASSLDR
jgi:peptidoglycan/LPS O-acetylase OafA/YrhL